MSAKKAWVLYTVLKLLSFFIPFTLIMLALPRTEQLFLGWGTLFALVCSGVISVAVSVLFLSKLRHRAAESIEEWRRSGHVADATAEDDYVDAQNSMAEAESQALNPTASSTAKVSDA